MDDKLKQYCELLTNTYDEAVELLLKKYGSARDDYYRENSYNRFLAKEITKITKGKYSRAKEGLYCHHIYEDKAYNLSNELFIREFEPPFEYQKRENLVYCDLVEHLILHVLIMGKTDGIYGTPGFHDWLRPMVNDWYVSIRKLPKPKWMESAYYRSFLTQNEAKILLDEVDRYLLGVVPNAVKGRLQHEKDEKERQLEKERKEDAIFYNKYPNLQKSEINRKTSRKKILQKLKELDIEHSKLSDKEYNSLMISVDRDQLLNKLNELSISV